MKSSDLPLWLHRVGNLMLAPLLWLALTIAYICAAPFVVAYEVAAGLRGSWNQKGEKA